MTRQRGHFDRVVPSGQTPHRARHRQQGAGDAARHHPDGKCANADSDQREGDDQNETHFRRTGLRRGVFGGDLNGGILDANDQLQGRVRDLEPLLDRHRVSATGDAGLGDRIDVSLQVLNEATLGVGNRRNKPGCAVGAHVADDLPGRLNVTAPVRDIALLLRLKAAGWRTGWRRTKRAPVRHIRASRSRFA